MPHFAWCACGLLAAAFFLHPQRPWFQLFVCCGLFWWIPFPGFGGRGLFLSSLAHLVLGRFVCQVDGFHLWCAGRGPLGIIRWGVLGSAGCRLLLFGVYPFFCSFRQ